MTNNQTTAFMTIVSGSERQMACFNRVFYTLTGSSRWLIFLLAVACFNPAWGGAQSDPTRPAPAWLPAQPHIQAAAASEEHEAPSVMQLILIGKSRKFAIIDGQVVKPGDTYNGLKVLDIKSSEVVLQDASKSLKLTPAVEKKVGVSTQLKKPVEATPNVLLNSDGGVR